MGNPERIKADSSNNLAEVLTGIFPARKSYWNKNPWNKLNISFLPDIPFGPDPEVLASALFDSLEDELELLVKHFALKRISVGGLNPRGSSVLSSVKFTGKKSEKELHLTAIEANKLIDVIKRGEYTDSILLSLFISPEKVFSFILPRQMDFKTLFSTAGELNEFKLENFTDSIDRTSLTPEAIIGSTPIRHLSISGWQFESHSDLLFTYPNFNRTIAMKEIKEKHEEPCINCLVCASVCPAGLYPATLYHHLKEENLAESIAMGLKYCMYCRRCSIVCPSNIPLSTLLIDSAKPESGDSV